MPNDSNIIEEHLRIVIDPSTYSEIDKISESVRNMREDFSEMPHLGEMLNSSLERTSTLTDTVNRKLQKASDITFDTQDDRDRFSANAHASVEDLRVMHKLQSTNDDFNPAVVRSWAKGLSSALSKELDAIIPDLAGIFRSRMSPLTTAGNSAYKNAFQEVAGLSQAMFQDKSVQQLLKSRVTQSYSDDVIKQLLRVVVANSSPMMRLDDYTNLRYNSNVRENAKAAELNSPIALLPASFQSSFKNKGYLSRGGDANEQRKWLTASAYKVIQKLLAENPVAVNAAVRSGIARRDDRGVLELQRNISRKDYDDLRRSIYGEFTARATGAGEHRVADIYTDDPAAAKIVAGRMAGSSSAGSVIRAMQQLEALESTEAWMDRQRQGSAYIKQPKEPKRVLDQYSILSFAPFDSTKRPQKEVSITESNNTRLLGLHSRGYNGDASDTIATISLSGYDKNNEAHVAELRKLFEEGKEIQSIGGKTVRMRVQSMHRGDDGAILRLVEESAMAAVDERLRPIAEAAGLNGSYWTNYQNTDKFDDLVHYRKHLDARNKGWTPSADLGLNLDGKKIAVVSMSTVDGDHKTELADGTGWLSEGILPTPIQFRGGVSGKGTLRPLPGETNRDFAIRSGLATQDQDGQWHWYVQGANPNDAPIDIIDYNGFVDKSVIKNMSAYRNADGTLKNSEEINDTFMDMLRISPLSVVQDFSKADTHSDRLGVQMMSYMKINPELQQKQIDQLSKRLLELDTEEGRLKYVFPYSNTDYLSTQVNAPDKRWLLQGAEADKRVALYREELIRKAMSGEWIDFGDDPNDSISNVEIAGSPLAAFFRMNGVNDQIRSIAKKALVEKFGREYSDQEIDDILKLKGTTRNNDGSVDYGYAIDFNHMDQKEISLHRSPTGYGNLVVAKNIAPEIKAIYDALANNVPDGVNPTMFSRRFLETGGVVLSPEDMLTLSGADIDADKAKVGTGSIKDMAKATIEGLITIPEESLTLFMSKLTRDGIVSDSIDEKLSAVDDLTSEPLGMGLGSGASIRGMMFDPAAPDYVDRIRGSLKGAIAYDGYSTIFKDPKEIARDKDIDKAIAAGKEYTRFTQNVKDIFSLDEDMYDDKGNVLDAHQDMYRAANGTIINMRKLKELDLLHTNLPSVYMDNHVLGLASMGRQYREGRVDTTRFDAMAEALFHMSEYDQELYNTAGVQTKSLMDTVNQLYPQFGTGKRTKLTEDETKKLHELYDSALGEIVQQAMEQEVVPGRVLNNEGKQVSTNWLVHNLKKKYGLTRVENTLKEFGFTDNRLAVGLPESLQEFFVNSADSQLNIPEVSQVNVAAVAANAPQIVEQLNKAKEEAAAEINKLEQEKAELEKKLFGEKVAGGVYVKHLPEEEREAAESRWVDVKRQIESKQSAINNSDAMQSQAIEWYKDQVEFESVFASAREFNSGLWKSRLSKEAHIEDRSQADLYYNKQHGIANYHATMLDDLIKRTGLSGEQKASLIKLRSDILSGVDVDFADKTVSNAKHLSESLNARAAATSIDYDKSEHEIDGYIKKLKEAEEYQKKLIDMDSEGKFTEEIKQTGEYIASGYQTAEKLRHNLYTQDIAGEDKMITRLQRFTRDRNRRYNQSAFERQILVNENDYEQYEQQYEALSHRLGIWQSRRRGLVANGQTDTENYRLATQEINRLSSALSDCRKEMDGLRGANGKLNAAFTVIGQAVNHVISQFGRQVFHRAINEAKNFVTTYDAAMTEIQMVTLKTNEEIDTLGAGLIDKAVDLKAGTGEVTSAAISLYRQGLSDAEVDSRLEDVIKFSKTAKVKTTDAIKLATVAMNSGNIESPKQAFDVVSALGDSAATEAAQITKGLQKSLSAAQTVGVSFEELVAMLTVITSKTQLSGSVAGTTMRNIMSRMSRFGDPDSRYASQVQVLKSHGIEIFENGEMRNVTKVLSEIGEQWENFDDITKADIAYALGGTEQFSNVTALIEGFSEEDEITGENLMQKYIEMARNSDGITDEKYQHQIESLDGALTNLTTTFQQLVESVSDVGAFSELINAIADGVTGFTLLNEETDGTIGRLGIITGLMLALKSAWVADPYRVGIVALAAGAVAAGNLYKQYKEANTPKTYAELRTISNQGYDRVKSQIDDAENINAKRANGEQLNKQDYESLERLLTSLNTSGQLTFDGLTDSAGVAITSIYQLAASADATATALANASTVIDEQKKQQNYRLSVSAANAVDDPTSRINYEDAKYVNDHSGLMDFIQTYETEDGDRIGKIMNVREALETFQEHDRTSNSRVYLPEYAYAFIEALANAGALDGTILANGDLFTSLMRNSEYSIKDVRGAIDELLLSDYPFAEGSVLDAALKYANGTSSVVPFIDGFKGFGDYNSDNIYQSIIGRDDIATSGYASLLHKTLVSDVNRQYAKDNNFDYSDYLESILREGYKKYLQRMAPEEYAQITPTSEEEFKQLDALSMFSNAVNNAKASRKEADYEAAWIAATDIMRTATGTPAERLLSFVTSITDEETGLNEWNEMIRAKGSEQLVDTWSSLVKQDKDGTYRLRDDITSEEAEVFERVLASMSERTSLIGLHRSIPTIAKSAQNTFDKLTEDGVDTNSVWQNLSTVDELNKLAQSELVHVLGEDLVAQLVNGTLDANGINYAQRLIDSYAANSRVQAGYNQESVRTMVKGFTGSPEEQWAQYGQIYEDIAKYEKAQYAMDRINTGDAGDQEYSYLANAIGQDAQFVERQAETNEGRQLLAQMLSVHIGQYRDILSQALMAWLDPSIAAQLTSEMNTESLLKLLEDNLTEDAFAFIKTLIDSFELTFNADTKQINVPINPDSGSKTPWQATLNAQKQYNQSHRDDEMLQHLKTAVVNGGNIGWYLEQNASNEDWKSFFSNNQMVAAAFRSYGENEGILDQDQMLRIINEAMYGGEKSADYYGISASSILGDNYQEGNLDWRKVLGTYETLKNTDIGDALIGSMEETEEGVQIIELLNNALKDGEINAESAEEALKRYNDSMGSRQLSQVTKYDKANQKVVETFEALASGGSDAAKAYNDLMTSTRNLSNAEWALKQYKSGSRSDKVTDILSSQFGLDSKALKKASKDDAKAMIQTMEMAYNEQFEILKKNFDYNFSDISDYVAQAQANTGGEFQIKDYVVNGKVNISALLKAFSEAGVIVDQTWAAVVQAMAASATFGVTADGDQVKLDLTNIAGTGSNYYGGGGGSKKSSAEKLVERLGHGQSLYEHQIKMVQYEQTKYENADELGNYGKMLEEELEIERAYLPVLESNIAALRNELGNVKEGSEDWYRLRDAILEAEEQYANINNIIEENEKKLEENNQAILKLHTDLEEMVVGEIELRIDAEKEMLDGSVSMQETVLNAIKQRYQDEWDLIKQDIEKKKEALQQEKDLIDERLDARRDAEDEAAKYEELAELKKQLSLISMDSTRTKDAAALRESIAELEKEIGWDIAEKEAENEKNAIQDQIDAYDDYVTKGDEDLDELLSDANNFAEEINGVMKLNQSELFDWLKQNVKEYANSLDDAQKQMVQSWEATYKQMLGITDTYWDEVNAILSSKDIFLEYMKQSNEYIYASEDERAQLLYQWEEAYDMWRKAQKNDADYSHGDSGLGDWSGSEYTGSSSGSSGGSGSSSTTNNQYTGTPNESGWASSQYSENNYRVEGSTADGKPLLSYNDSLETAKAAAASTSKSTGKPVSIYSPDGKLMYKYINGQAIAYGTTAQASGASGNSNAHWKFKIHQDGKVVKETPGFTSRENAQTAAAEYIKKNNLSGAKYTTHYYKKGGIADYTGLAWLDGTPTEPERILSADQTRDFEALVAIMDDFRNSGISMDVLRSMAKWSTSVSVPASLSHIGSAAYQGNSANVGDIFVNITEAQIADDRDIEELANIVGQKFVKEIGKQGFNVSRYNF